MLGEESETFSSQNLPPDKFFNPGSTISLKCIIRRHIIKNATISEITNVTWKKNGLIIDLQMQERFRKVENEKWAQKYLVKYSILQYGCCCIWPPGDKHSPYL